MVKKTKYESNNFDIDTDLDLPDFEFESGQVTADRNPVITVAKSTLKGAAKAVLNPSVIRSTIRKTMPKEYGDAMDLADHGADSMRSLYDTAAKEFRPVANDLKRITGKVAPSVEGVLPKKITDALKKWSKTDGSSGVNVGAERQRDDSILMELGNIFKIQSEVQDKKDKADKRQEQFQQGIDQIRHRDQIGQLDSIRIGIDRLATYQDKVLSNYQKKSLELQFRQYFATADLLEVQKKAAADIDAKLAAIQKNTALPEYVKINETERFAELARNKFYSDIRDNMFGGTDGTKYIKDFVDNIKNALTEKIKGAASAAREMTFGLDMMSDMGGGDDEFGPSKYEMAGDFAGGVLGNYGVGKLQKWGKKQISKRPALARKVAKGAENLSYRMNNSGQLINDYFDDYENDWGPLEGLRQFLGDNRPGLSSVTRMQTDSLADMNKAKPFSQAAHKSIVEIIPGYLARIHRELQVMRTGDESIQLATYDYDSNKFTTEKGVGAKLIGSFANKDNQEMIRSRQDELLSFVDPEGKFTDEQKKAVRDQALKMSLNRSSTDSKRLTDPATWRGAGKGASAIADAFATLLEADMDGKRGDSLEAIKNQNKISNSVRNLTSGLDDPRAKIQDMINAGQYDAVRNSGLVDENGRLSITAIARLLSGETIDDLYSDGNAVLPGKGSMPAAAVNVRQKPGTAARGPKQRATFNKKVSRLDTVSTATAPQSSPEVLQKLTDIEDLVKAPPTMEPLKTIAEMVTSIDKRMAAGLIVYGDTTGNFVEGPGEFVGPVRPDWVTEQVSRVKDRVKKGWSDISLGEIGSNAKKWGLKGLGMARKHAKKLSGMAMDAFNKTRTLAKDTLQSAADKMGDIYVGNETSPRLTRAKMLAGEYFDKTTGNVITSLDDIKGEVVDKAGNVILSLEDLKTAQMRGKITEFLIDKVKGLGALIAKGAVYAGGLIKGMQARMLTAGIAAAKLAKKYLPPYDVYVAGDMEKPVLYATEFRLLKYFSQKTGAALRHPRDIDGQVLDKDGNIIVNEEMLKKGLVDRNGIAISNVLGRALNKVKDVAMKGFNFLKKVGGKLKGLALGALGGMGEFFKNIFGGISYFGEKYVEINKDQLDVQLEILKVLKERLPKRTTGDADGDGDREGSVEDILARRKAEKEAKAAKLAGLAGDAGEKSGKLGSMFGALSGLIKKNTEAVEEAAEEADGGLLDDAADIADIADAATGDGPSKGKKAGRLARMGKGMSRGAGKLGRLAKGAGSKMLKPAGRLAGTMGRLALAMPGLGGVMAKGAGMIGSAGMKAIGLGARALPFLAKAGGALMSKGTVFAAAKGVGTVVGAVVSSPVVLTALGVAALAGGAYLGYKYLTRKKLETLSKVRYAQYGFLPTDEDHFKVVFEMEDKLEKLVKFDKDKARIDMGKLTDKELMEPFGIKPDDERGAKRWSIWFESRFKPVFLAHMAALKLTKPDTKLEDVDGSKLTAAEKLKYLNATQVSDSFYEELISPFADHDVLKTDARAVKAQFEVAKAELEKESKKDQDAAKSGGAMGALKSAVMGAAAAVGLAPKPVENKAGDDKAASLVSKLNKPATAVAAGAAISAKSNVPADSIFTGERGRLDALSTIRYKTYGLTKLDSDKVRALRALEVYVARNTTYDTNGAKYSQDAVAILDEVKASFGISGPSSPKGLNWIKWFRARFLPVFLNFATTLQKTTKKNDIIQAERSLTAEQAISIASAVYTTSTVYNDSNVSVWKVIDCSPWDDYPLNDDEKSIDGNMEALKETAKAVVRKEHTSSKIQTKVDANRRENEKEAAAVARNNAAANRSGSGGSGGTISGRANSAGVYNGSGERSIYGNNGAESINADGTNVRSNGDFMGGVELAHPGNGTSGDINSLPQMKGIKGWQASKDLFMEAAKMTGVDPRILVNIAAVESGFDPSARPWDEKQRKYLSSAKGFFQFIDKTWRGMINNYGKKYGIAPGTSAMDPRANVLMGAELIKENMRNLRKRIGRNLTATDVYMAHFLGEDVAGKFLKMDPNTPAATVMRDEASSNPHVYYDSNKRMRTAGEIYSMFTRKLVKTSRGYGVVEPGLSLDGKAGATPLVTKAGAGTSSSASTAAAPTSMPVPEGAKSGPPGSAAVKAGAAGAAGAVTAAATTPAKTGATAPTSPGGKSPMPGSAATASKSAPTPAPTQPAVTAPPPVRSAPGGFGGFQPDSRPTSQEIRAMDESNKPGLIQGLGDINRTLQESLGIHRNSHGVLVKILEKMQGSAPATPPGKTSPMPQASKEVPSVAVKMGRSE